MKAKYKLGQRLAFIARNECDVKGERILGKWTHFVGYVQQIRHCLFGVRYVMQASKTNDIYIVPQRDIIDIVERKETNTNKSNKTDGNGD